MTVNVVDLAIVAAAVIGLVNGYRRGFWLSLAQYAGLFIGVLLGAAAAGPLLDYIGIHNPVARPLGAVLVLVIGGSLGSSIGFAAGEPIRRKILRQGLHTTPDSIGGAVLSTFAVLVMCWFLGLSFSRGPSQEVAQQIQRSTVLRTLDLVVPHPPEFLARVEGILSGVTFPPVFAGLEPSLPAPLPIPAVVDTQGVKHAAQVVVKVTGTGCGGLVTGSGFPIGNGYFVTNAHVVSGTGNHSVETPDGRALRAEVVYFDPDRDVALLFVPDFTNAALSLAPAERGTQGAVIGYPGGGSESVQPAVVDGAVEAAGRDIYNQKPVTREIYVIQGRVRPGNSGGPLVDLTGRVLGIVFATSASEPDQAYALTDDEITTAEQKMPSPPSPVDTSHLQCAA
ncbi:MAG TPA: MarP family serine protease [Candidatus Dormibacteraeota bacterium]|nr:MarP family serine protease [Candidatus Dormibacteraeota bacterium]